MYKDKVTVKKMAKERIRKRIRKRIKGSSERPRVYVFKSNRYVYAQVIDDENGHILASASTLEKEFKGKNKNFKNTEACQVLGGMLVKKLKQKKIERVIFDRGIYPYHGRIKAFAEAMRKGGLVF
ncbi:MAG: 50S ribosomal protein L18 [Candidatus Aminicenantes bacterium]|nr:50S ribosomal protein L18 [Candidatus Aminicenantes bacterium]